MSWKRKTFSDVDKWRPESNRGERGGHVLGVPAWAASPSLLQPGETCTERQGRLSEHLRTRTPMQTAQGWGRPGKR